MAGDWIKVQHVTPDKPEVFQMADHLGIDPDAVVGKLIRVWIWADQQTTNGNADVTQAALHDRYRNVTKSLLDRLTNVTGFADAMESSGWLVYTEGGFVFPNFERNNGNTAKARSLTAKRVSGHRSCNADVTQPALHDRYKSVTREEKRREENINTPDSSEDDIPWNNSPDEETKPVPKVTTKRTRKPKVDDALFDAFWEAYPKKKYKPSARDQFAKACGKADALVIIEAAREFAVAKRREDRQFLPNAAKWLKEECWTEDREQWKNGRHKKIARPLTKEELAAWRPSDAYAPLDED